MTLKLAHVSDVHLGAKLVYLGSKADDHRNNIKKSFQNAVATAVQKSVDIFVIAGDLFDSPFPSKSVQMFALENIKKLVDKGIYVVLISGNHDRATKGSVYDSSIITEFKNEKFKLIAKEAQEEWLIGELGTRIVAAGTEYQKNKKMPYGELKADPKYKFNVGVFHGSADIKGEPENNPIRIVDLKASKFSYFALGDWHNTLQVAKGLNAWYSGSPELIDSDQDKAGNMLLVKLDEEKAAADVEIIKVGTKAIYQKVIDVGIYKSFEEIIQSLKKDGNKDLMLNLTLKGLKSIDFIINDQDIIQLLNEDYYFVNVKDETQLKLTDKDLANYPSEMLIGRYIKLLMDQKKEGDTEGNEIKDEAIQLGVTLLKGGKL
jgi:DNA repair protein SbcD/Mre11